MSGTIIRIGATGAGALLALGIFATPPAGAAGGNGDGKGQRTLAACFTADGHTQGRSQSDPDGMSNGGFDKPGCTGGFDSDRDGNNGCGNDADREDDNNGNCGAPKDRPAAEPAAEADKAKGAKVKADAARVSASGTGTGSVVNAAGTTADAGASAAGTDGAVAAAGSTAGTGVPSTAPAVEPATAAAVPGTSVLGESITRPSVLARTGAGLGGLALLGALLCGGGRIAILARRSLRIG